MENNETTYRAYLKIKEDFKEALGIDWQEVIGSGSHLQDMAKQCIAVMILSDNYSLYEKRQYIESLLELIEQLEYHQDDYVKVTETPFNGFNIEDYFEDREDYGEF